MTARRDRRPYGWGFLTCAALGVLGMAWRDAALVGLVVLVAVHVVLALLPRAGDPSWPRPRDLDADGVRREVADITWMFSGLDGKVSEEAVRRLRADATRCLARRGVVVPSGLGSSTPRRAAPEVVAEARALLGERVWAILTSPGGWMPSLTDVAHCVDVLEHLSDAAARPVPAAPPPGTTRRPRRGLRRGTQPGTQPGTPSEPIEGPAT